MFILIWKVGFGPVFSLPVSSCRDAVVQGCAATLPSYWGIVATISSARSPCGKEGFTGASLMTAIPLQIPDKVFKASVNPYLNVPELWREEDT